MSKRKGKNGKKNNSGTPKKNNSGTPSYMQRIGNTKDPAKKEQRNERVQQRNERVKEQKEKKQKETNDRREKALNRHVKRNEIGKIKITPFKPNKKSAIILKKTENTVKILKEKNEALLREIGERLKTIAKDIIQKQNLQDEKTKLEKEKTKLENEISNIQIKNIDSLSSTNKQPANEFKNQYSKKNQRLKTVTEKIEELDNEIEELDNEIEELEDKNANIAIEIESNQETINKNTRLLENKTKRPPKTKKKNNDEKYSIYHQYTF